MQETLIKVILLSLQITSIHVVLQPGALLGEVRWLVATATDKLNRPVWTIYVLKPFSDCLTCMGWFWTIVLTATFDIELMLCVCGLNHIISIFIDNEKMPDESKEPGAD